MSNTRVRYVPVPGRENVVQSKTVFTVNSESGRQDFRIYVDLNEMKFLVRSENNSTIEREGTASTENKLKSMAKKSLMELGVSFGNETRSKSGNGTSAGAVTETTSAHVQS
jgi:hypothetical protein